jgi:hypothetical protein
MLHPATKRYKTDNELINHWQGFVSDKILSPLLAIFREKRLNKINKAGAIYCSAIK